MRSFWKIFSVLALIIIAVFTVRFLSGPEDAWLCRDGRWVRHGQPGGPAPAAPCGGEDQTEDIIVLKPSANQPVYSPLTVEGRARGSWFFEASLPIELTDKRGETLARSYVQAQSDWMTEELVPFKGELDYQLAATTTGWLILKNDNPSGLKENEKSFILPVVIGPSQNIILKAFFNNNNLDPAVSCDKVFAVNRRAVKTEAVARAALEELLKGPTAAEKAQGYFTNINSGVKINKLTIVGGTAKVDFDEAMEKGLGGSCRVSAIRAQISETLKQFSSVKDIIISVDGRTEDILQP